VQVTVIEHPAREVGFVERGTGNRAEQIAERIAELVGDALPGSRLGYKHELRHLCGGSVGTFNEALRLAQSRGLIVARPGPGGGVFVAHRPTSPVRARVPWDGVAVPIAEAVRIRAALEPLVVEDALWHASPADISALRSVVRRAGEAVAAHDTRRFVQCDRDLHASLADLGPHVVLRGMYHLVLDAVLHDGFAILRLHNDTAGHLRSQHRRQTELITALEARDLAGALRAIRRDDGTEPKPRRPS
jgi:DNA-binding FadR family transcriptional regulator